MKISCLEVRRELSNYIEKDVTREVRKEIEAHFVRCPGCMAIYDGVNNVIRLVTDIRLVELPEGFSQGLYQRLLRTSPFIGTVSGC